MGCHQILSLLCVLFYLHSSLPVASPLCPPDQRNALVNFKNSFLLHSDSSRTCEEDYHVTSYPKTLSWSEGVDCCLWEGVTCDSITGNIVSLDLTCSWLYGALHSNSSLFLLSHLRNLNLFGNDFFDSPIPPNLTIFENMTHLNLSRSQFLGDIPSEISRLSKLESLDLSFCPLELESSIFAKLVQNLTALRELALHSVNMSTISPESFMNFSSLRYLSVGDCHLRGKVPESFLRLPSLTHLDMSDNSGLSGILPNSNWTGPLESLSLSGTSFSGEIPESIGNVKYLTVLDLTGCKFTGLIPSSLGNLKQLQFLNLSSNNFGGVVEFKMVANNEVKDAFPNLGVLDLSYCNFTKFPFFLNSLKRLTYLDLSYNRISGKIPKWFWEISLDTLEHLDLSQNLLEGGIPQLHWKLLSYINLRNNSFQGSLPIPSPSTSYFHADDNGFTGEIHSSICQLTSLLQLGLSNNMLFGNIPPCFGNITNLVFLNLSSNNLRGPLPRSLDKCVKLSRLDLSHNKFSDIFPYWLEAPNLLHLNLQSNKFHGRISITNFALSFPTLEVLLISNNNFTGQWPIDVFSNWALQSVKMSNNNFSGRWPTTVFLNTSLLIIDLSNNKFEGPIPLPPVNTLYYSIASNRMTGKIPSYFCNVTEVIILDLSDNDLTGSLPQCFTNLSFSPSVLNLRKNHLEGTITQLFPLLNTLTTLDLSQNQFEGTLPRSLVHCENLEFLDLSDNRIEDTFPTWLGTLRELKILILRSNNFKGLLNIPSGAHLFPNLHILDLSNNNFGGPLPTNLFMNLTAMTNNENGQEKPLYMTSLLNPWYEDSVTVVMKGQELRLMKILTVFTIIDLACNSFQGDIPGAIGLLNSLIGLDLSHNHLTGSIPLTLGNLTNLEWLDLSSNKISGAIPRNLGDLTFLGYLNLSENRFIGRIPQDKHLSTFSSNSFRGNPGLCGTPLPKACPADTPPPQPSPLSTFNEEGHDSWFKQEAMWIGYASGIVIGISISCIAFELGRPIWLMRGVMMLERRAAEWTKKPRRKAIKSRGK